MVGDLEERIAENVVMLASDHDREALLRSAER
jgi:hypothetical protein